MASYYAFHYPDARTEIHLFPPETARARGFLQASRTGIDLFRPLVTLRFPAGDPEGAADLVYSALAPGSSVFIHAPADYQPLLSAFFTIDSEQRLFLYRLERARFEPEVNVLVARSKTPDGMPRFVIRPTSGEDAGEVGAAASINWQTATFAEISVYTNPAYRQRGWGRSVVAALVNYVLQQGQTPLYAAAEDNLASQELARSVGFVNTRADKILLSGSLRPRP
jgi:RimJ/RimL family protein N-acetyltransferase